MENLEITNEVLLKNDFIQVDETPQIQETYKDIWELNEFFEFDLVTSDEHPLKINMMSECTNNGARWHLHIDNDRCESIGSADIDYIWQFNKIMEVFNSNFRLK